MQSAVTAGVEASTVVMLYLVSYCFLLRVPSEALPMARGSAGFDVPGQQQSVLSLEGDRVVLKLARRKNLPQGSVMYRSCWCNQCKLTCPVHVLWKFFVEFDIGEQPFKGISAGAALSMLRNLLEWMQIPGASGYRTHDMRRGHARDLQEGGASLFEILQAGQWRSPAFFTYLDVAELEHSAVVEAHMNESSDED